MPKSRPLRWIEEMEARKVREQALLQCAVGGPVFGISAQPEPALLRRIRSLFGLAAPNGVSGYPSAARSAHRLLCEMPLVLVTGALRRRPPIVDRSTRR
jgi:hypothetical protein